MAEFNDDIVTKAGLDLSGCTSITLPTTAGLPYQVESFTQTVLFSDLGAGASDTIALTGLATNILLLGAAIEINTAFAGEADVAVSVGDTGDPDELITAFTLDSVAAGFVQGLSGAAQLGKFETDYVTAGGTFTFTATELNDVTAGSLTLHIFYITPILATA